MRTLTSLTSTVLLVACALSVSAPCPGFTPAPTRVGTNFFAGNSSIGSVTGGLVSSGVWSAEAEDRDGDGRVEFVTVRCATPSEERWIRLGTREPGRDLEAPGTFLHAGPDADGLGNVLDGTEASDPDAHSGFTVLDVRIDWTDGTPRVERLVARYASRARYDNRMGFGLVVFEGAAIPEIGRVRYTRESRKLEILGNAIALSDRAWVDGVEFPLKVTGDRAFARRVRLEDGVHTLRIGAPSGFVSAERSFEVPDPGSTGTSTCLLKLRSSPGEYIGQGMRHRIRGTDVRIAADDLSRDGRIDTINLTLSEGMERWYLDVGTTPVGSNLESGLYPDSRGHPDVSGHPSFSITGGSRGCQDQTGFFSIDTLVFDWSQAIAIPTAIDLAFEMRCNIVGPLLRGSVYYASPGLPTIHGVSYEPAARQLRFTITDLDGDVRLTLDGAERGPVQISGDEAVLSLVDLEPDRHVFWVTVVRDFGLHMSVPVFFDVTPTV